MTVPASHADGRIAQLMALRVVTVTTLLVAAVYVETVADLLPSRNSLYALIVATYALTLLYAFALRLRARRVVLLSAQLVGDIALITGLVYLTGASRAGFQLLYPISALSGGILLYRRGGLVLAATATIFYGALLSAVRLGWVAPRGLADVQDVPARTVAYSVFVTGVVCAVVAWAGSYMAQSLRKVGEQLEQATEEMADLREVTEVVVESIQSGLIMADVEGRIQFVNPQGLRLLGTEMSGLKGMTLDELFDAVAFEASTLRFRAEERRFSRVSTPYRRPDGVELEIGLSVSPLARGRRGYLMVFQDLTEVRRLQREVQLKDRLAAAGEMAAQLAHEIRNPLGSISGAAQMLLGESGLPEEHQRLLAIIRRESQRLSETLERFLGQARSGSAARREPVDLGVLVKRAATLLRNGLDETRGHSVDLSCDAGPHVCIADEDAITQVFWNLARNGLEAMPSGGVLGVGLRRADRDIVLTITDEGPGLAGQVGRLFEPFVSESPVGTGLGLAIVYRIVRDHGGDIVLRSRSGKGTEAEVRLPAAVAGQPVGWREREASALGDGRELGGER